MEKEVSCKGKHNIMKVASCLFGKGGVCKKSEDIFFSAVNHLVEGIMVTDDEGNIKTFNKTCEHILGYTSEDVIGQSLCKFLPHDYLDYYEQALFSYHTGRFTDIVGKAREIEGLKKNGQIFPMEISFSELELDKDKKLLAVQIRDLSDRARIERELQNYISEAKILKHQAEDSNKAKNSFLATVSHKIRTPMNDIMGMAGMLIETKLDDRQRKYSLAIMNSSKVLLDIINNLVDLSRIENRNIMLEESAFDLKGLMQSIADMTKIDTNAKNIPLIFEFRDDVPRYVIGDNIRIRQIVLNLLSNAVKFTKRGSIEFIVEKTNRALTAGDRADIKITIKDTGIGIPLDRQAELFSKFASLDKSNWNKEGGMGLGLTVSKHMVEFMGGELGFESTEGEGSSFWASLNLLIAEGGSQCRDDNTREVDVEKLKGVKVLLTEDNPTNREFECEILKSLGCEVEVADGGRVSIDLLKLGNKYDMVFMDIHMPEMDGFEATSIIRGMIKKGEIDYVPVIAITARAVKGDREQCLDAGMDDYISKPFTRNELVTVIDRWNLKNNELKTCAIVADASRAEDKYAAVDYFSIETMKDLMGNKYPELLKQFVKTTDDAIMKMADIVENEGSLEEVVVEAHSLKSSGAYMGAKEISAIAKDLELGARLASEDAVKIDEMRETFTNLEKSWQKVRGIYVEELNNLIK